MLGRACPARVKLSLSLAWFSSGLVWSGLILLIGVFVPVDDPTPDGEGTWCSTGSGVVVTKFCPNVVCLLLHSCWAVPCGISLLLGEGDVPKAWCYPITAQYLALALEPPLRYSNTPDPFQT